MRNKIAQAIVERIKRAHAKGEKYKVFIIIPLIPAFEGDLASKDASAARNVMHFQYVTISRGGNSIMEKLREANIEPSDYIGWYSLRTWDKLVPPKREKAGSKPNSKKSDSNLNNNTKKSTFTTDTIKSNDTNNKSPIVSSPSPAPSNSTKETTASVESLNKDPLSHLYSTTPSPSVTPIPTSSGSNTNSNVEVEEEKPKDIWDDDDREHYVSELVYIHDKILIVDDRIVLTGSGKY